MDTAALISALARAALDAGWALEVSEPGQDEKGPLLVIGLRPNPSPYGVDSSVARAKARVAMVSAAFMDRYERDRQAALAAVESSPGDLEGEVDPD